MGQTFIILLRVGLQNNAKLKPVHNAKTFSDPGVTDGGHRANRPAGC